VLLSARRYPVLRYPVLRYPVLPPNWILRKLYLIHICSPVHTARDGERIYIYTRTYIEAYIYVRDDDFITE
jgi:hypothetical protein